MTQSCAMLARTTNQDASSMTDALPQPMLQVESLKTYFPVSGRLLGGSVQKVHAVDDVSFDLLGGETLGLVGESGCGKSTTGRTILRLVNPTSGSIRFEGQDLAMMSKAEVRRQRRHMQMIFQDPYSTLDPRMSIGATLNEAMKVNGVADSRAERTQRAADLLERVGLSGDHLGRFPHEFSGGQRQRVGIARALSVNPKLVVCDEPVSALDVSVQSQVMNLLQDLQHEFNLTFLFIAHDLAVVEHISTRIAVMYLGKIVEIAPARKLYTNPRHPYSEALLSAVPIPDPKQKNRDRIVLTGDVPSPINPPTGCRFHTRCPMSVPSCAMNKQRLVEVSPGHLVACQERTGQTEGEDPNAIGTS